jgi:hypothetical protein
MQVHLFTKYLEHLTHKQVKPGFFAELIFKIRETLDSNWRMLFDHRRFFRINALPNNPLEKKSSKFPSIELLLVTKSKDIELLELVISNALKNSLNPISLIKVIVPEGDVETVKQIQWSFKDKFQVLIQNEDSVIPIAIRKKLKAEFKGLYGWVLAQYLKIWTVSNSSSKGVLVLDADTILISPRLFLDGSGKQILTPSVEYHNPYYDFLENARPFFGEMKDSFISHHMLMQPYLAKKALSFFHNSLDELTSFVLKFYEKNEQSPFCLCFEVYAQYVVTHESTSYELAKWSNLSVKRERVIGNQELIRKYARNFNSISLHSWL